MGERRRKTSWVRAAGVAITGILLAIAMVMMVRNLATTKVVLSYGEVTATSRFGKGGPVMVRTRRVKTGELVFEELEQGPDTWIDCAGDCAETLRKQDVDFWETRQRWEH
ncbi:MAG: hypothetical protein ACR2O4_15195 [Hyphomicrobiaceae bacterium]